MSAPATRQGFLERYHSLQRRHSALDPSATHLIHLSFAGTIGPWLPADHRAPLLDVACGEGSLLSFLRDRDYTNLHAFDISPENVSLCHQRGFPFVRLHDAVRLEHFPGPAHFHTILCLDLLEHLDKETALPFLREARRRLAPAGSLILQTPNMGCLFALFNRYDDLSHEFALTEGSLLSLLCAAGFAQREIEIRPCWNAATSLGRVREFALRSLHKIVWAAAGCPRPRIPTRNLLAKAVRSEDLL